MLNPLGQKSREGPGDLGFSSCHSAFTTCRNSAELRAGHVLSVYYSLCTHCQPAVGGMHCLLSAPLLQQRCCHLVIFSSSIIESVLSKLVERLLTLLYIALLEIQKITLNCVNIVVLLIFLGFFLEVRSIYSVSVKGN